MNSEFLPCKHTSSEHRTKFEAASFPSSFVKNTEDWVMSRRKNMLQEITHKLWIKSYLKHPQIMAEVALPLLAQTFSDITWSLHAQLLRKPAPPPNFCSSACPGMSHAASNLPLPRAHSSTSFSSFLLSQLQIPEENTAKSLQTHYDRQFAQLRVSEQCWCWWLS